MDTWTNGDLDTIGSSDELELATRRADGTLSAFVTMWVVRAGNDLYVRSAHGPDNPWYRRARSHRAGTIRAGGLQRDVIFAAAVAEVHEAIDAAYHAKYDCYGPQIVGSVVGVDTHAVTIRLLPAGELST